MGTKIEFNYKGNFCRYCGKELTRRTKQSNGEKESPAEYKRRKYCNWMCMRKGRIQFNNYEQSYTNTHTTARKVGTLFLDQTHCEICGKEGKLDIHHKDFNEQNNNIDNLQVLCRSCHMKIHRPKPTCNVPFCNNPVKGYGYCEKHYQHYKKYGNPLISNKGHQNYVLEHADGAWEPIKKHVDNFGENVDNE